VNATHAVPDEPPGPTPEPGGAGAISRGGSSVTQGPTQGGEGYSSLGLAEIEAHLTKLSALNDPPNAAMLTRLRAGETSIQDLNFYAHELIESGLMQGGMDARAAHLETLQRQGIPYIPGYESQLYQPDVIRQFPEQI
jgi:hypothetical protein